VHPAPQFRPIAVSAVVPAAAGTRSQRVNPWIPADGAAATICRMSAGYELREGAAVRKPTIPEVKALASFPPTFALAGSFADQWARIGNSVPPLLCRAIATEVRRLLDASGSCLPSRRV
jgi:site-specific DNA-cytosine methylase